MFEKIKEVLKYHEKNIIIIAVVLIVGGIAWNVFSPAVSNNSGGADTVRQQLDEIKQSQQSAIKRLDTVETGINRSADRVGQVSTGLTTNTNRISTIEQRITVDQAGLTTSSELIADCQRITKQVRERGKIGD